jgi:uncharacterized protein (DUF1778 family)
MDKKIVKRQNKDRTVIFRLTEEEKEMIKNYADFNQVSMSRAIVNAVQRAVSFQQPVNDYGYFILTDEMCIAHLKSQGCYKIFKTIEEQV